VLVQARNELIMLWENVTLLPFPQLQIMQYISFHIL